MKDIFTDLYKKVLGFFQTTQVEEENAKDVARNRLKLVLMQDRTNLTPYLLERMRGEMIEVLSKYVEMDKDELELNFEQEDGGMALMLSIPVVRAKDEEEIKAIIEAEDEKKKSDEAEMTAEHDKTEETEETEEETPDVETEAETKEVESVEESELEPESESDSESDEEAENSDDDSQEEKKEVQEDAPSTSAKAKKRKNK